MWLQHWLLIGVAFSAAACGTSRSTRMSACSSTKAIGDKSIGATSSLEKYDPSAVLLLFKATSDKLTVESRCNARLVNKVQARHKTAGGGVEEIGDTAIDYSRLQVSMDSGETNLELHTSAHCFYRIWDSRVENQVKSNPIIGAEPVRSLLQDMKTRYQLYRSMLTTPQTIIAYLPDRSTITLKYKLQTSELYEQFFAEVDKLKSDELNKIVGRELSKSSIILDELVRNECNVDQTNVARIERDFKSNSTDPNLTRASVTNSTQMIGYFNKLTRAKTLSEYLRTRITSSGRNKLCFSQTDMVVVPIRIAETINENQRQLFSEIENSLGKKIDDYMAKIAGTITTGEKFMPEINASTTAPVVPADLTSCSFSSTHPGIGLTDLFLKRMEKSYVSSWSTTSVQPEAFHGLMKGLFPNLKQESTSGQFMKAMLGEFLKEAKCHISGLQPNGSGDSCSNTPINEFGRCPSTLEEANTSHNLINLSLRLASTSAIHMLKRLRDSGALALSMPFAELRDYIQFACESQENGECENATRIKVILDALSPLHTVNLGSQTVNLTAVNNSMQVTSVTDDLQLNCKLLPKNPQITIDLSTKLFQNLSDGARELIKEGLIPVERDYQNFGARFIYMKCISAGSKRLYNNISTAHGLMHGLKFMDLSFVKTERSEFSGRIELSNSEVTQAGQPVRMPFAGLFIGEAAENLMSYELAAKLAGAPHIEISYCGAEKAQHLCDELTSDLRQKDMSQLATDIQLVRAHMNFLTKVPSWIPEAEKAKRGGVTFPETNFSAESARYYLSAGDSGTTVLSFGLWPVSMLSAVNDIPVSGGLAVIPSTGGQQVQSSKGADCR